MHKYPKSRLTGGHFGRDLAAKGERLQDVGALPLEAARQLCAASSCVGIRALISMLKVCRESTRSCATAVQSDYL